MKLEQQVTSLELSKKLKELGVPQNSLFYWEEYLVGENEYMGNKIVAFGEWECDEDEHLSAFTVAELGDLLMDFPYVGSFLTEFNEDGTVFFDIKFAVSENYKLIRERKNLYDKITDYQYHLFDNKKKNYPRSEADARAMFLIFLIKNGVIKLPDKKG
jgi:hypothetical protein